ncbi:MAG: GNAT family N-acetyltransferase [Terriglobia bacterium]
MPISELYGTHSDLLLEENGKDLAVRFFREIFQFERRWDVFVLWRLLEQSTLFSQIKSYLEESCIRYKLKREEPSFFITLDCSFDEYLKRRSSKFRNYLRRMEKKLSSCGKVEVKFFGNYDKNNSCFEEILAIERRSWKQNHRTSIASVGKQEIFYRNLYELSSKNGRWHLLIMYLDGRAIAYDMGIVNKGTYYYLKTSFDEGFRNYSPATVLRAQLIRDLISRGVNYFDFPGEPYEWESQWSNELRWHYSIVIYNSNMKATLLSVINRLRDKLRGEVVQDTIRYHDPLDTRPETT